MICFTPTSRRVDIHAHKYRDAWFDLRFQYRERIPEQSSKCGVSFPLAVDHFHCLHAEVKRNEEERFPSPATTRTNHSRPSLFVASIHIAAYYTDANEANQTHALLCREVDTESTEILAKKKKKKKERENERAEKRAANARRIDVCAIHCSENDEGTR